MKQIFKCLVHWRCNAKRHENYQISFHTMQHFWVIVFSKMQLNDTRIQEYGRRDGIQSILHCQDQFFISEGNFLLLTFENESYILFSDKSDLFTLIISVRQFSIRIRRKFKLIIRTLHWIPLVIDSNFIFFNSLNRLFYYQ